MSTSRTLDLPDLVATARLGARLAAQLAVGDIVCLTGDLGAGKTTLARQIIADLCDVHDAPSPTYTIVQAYDTIAGPPLWHVDLYRVENEDELTELGLDDAFDTAITLIEWPDRLGEDLPADRLEISLAMSPAGVETARQARITGLGVWESRLDDL